MDDIPVRICPHVPPDKVFLMQGEAVCYLCLQDAVEEAERIAREAAE